MIGIDATQLREYIVRPTLRFLDPEIPYSLAAENLLLGTAAQESKMGRWIDQLAPGPGPAYGLWQMEAATYSDHWRTFLQYRFDLQNKISKLVIPAEVVLDAAEMAGNLYLAAAMCRVHYRRRREQLPHASDVAGMGYYWKTYYNTHLGQGTIEEFVKSYIELVR